MENDEKLFTTLIIDGNWNLKRNFKKINALDAYKNSCGGTYGFIKSLYYAMNKVLPDRVIVAWDGIRGGKYRYDIYKPYKANRNKDWEMEERIYAGELKTIEDKEKYDLIVQKINLVNMLDELFIRQMEVDFIEADDLIAGYILKSQEEERNEKIIIFSRDRDFKQLISDKVSILTPDSIGFVTEKNFKDKNGYVLENELLFKCFDGDKSDCIEGVKGITKNTLMEHFPDIKDRKYTFQELSDRCVEILNGQKRKLKTLQKIIESRNILYRNATLMNLKKPFLNDESHDELRKVSTLPLDEDRSIKRLIATLQIDGYINLLKKDNISIGTFFSPFYRLMSKEKEYKEIYNKKS